MKKANQGFCAEIFEVENNRLLKLYFTTWSERDAKQEYEITKAIHEMGISSPAVYDFEERDGRYGFTMEKLEDVTMLHHIHKHLKEALLLAKQLAKMHFAIHSHSADASIIPLQEDAYLEKIQSRKTLSDEEKEQRECPYLLWEELRPHMNDLIKGKKSPTLFHVTLAYPLSKITDIQTDIVESLLLNIHFESGTLTLITATSLKTFSMDRSFEQYWDNYVPQFLAEKGLLVQPTES